MNKRTEIGAYKTKSRLSAFVRQVKAGQRFTITQRGKAVAELVPYGTSVRRAKTTAARQMQSFVRERSPSGSVDIKALIEEGRD